MNEAAPWSVAEDEALVADYFRMLTFELSGLPYNKSAHRKALGQLLNGRSEGAIERKHQNVSAVLIDLGCPYIRGYKPLVNYQNLLFKTVAEQLSIDSEFSEAAHAAVEQTVNPSATADWLPQFENAPEFVAKETVSLNHPPRRGIQRDYLEREARNRSLGEAGEALVLRSESARLYSAGKRVLSERVEHVARTRGDGLGYDVLSFDLDGRERFIEVKTTAFGRETPFYITRNELEFSRESGPQFYLYRLFEFRIRPRLFALEGPVDGHCSLDPLSYRARFD